MRRRRSTRMYPLVRDIHMGDVPLRAEGHAPSGCWRAEVRRWGQVWRRCPRDDYPGTRGRMWSMPIAVMAYASARAPGTYFLALGIVRANRAHSDPAWTQTGTQAQRPGSFVPERFTRAGACHPLAVHPLSALPARRERQARAFARALWAKEMREHAERLSGARPRTERGDRRPHRGFWSLQFGQARRRGRRVCWRVWRGPRSARPSIRRDRVWLLRAATAPR